MPNNELITWAVVGFGLGATFGFCIAAFSDGSAALAYGTLFAVLLPLFGQMISAARSKKNKSKEPRSQSQGSFDQRMERFSENVNTASSSPANKSKMVFWAASEADEYARTPPKPVGIIRMILIRIQKVLTGIRG